MAILKLCCMSDRVLTQGRIRTAGDALTGGDSMLSKPVSFSVLG